MHSRSNDSEVVNVSKKGMNNKEKCYTTTINSWKTIKYGATKLKDSTLIVKT